MPVLATGFFIGRILGDTALGSATVLRQAVFHVLVNALSTTTRHFFSSKGNKGVTSGVY